MFHIQDAISQTLRDRFKDLRRPRKPRTKSVAPACQIPATPSVSNHSPGITNPLSSPVIPAGEDSHSFLRHCKSLQRECQKKKPNENVVSDLTNMSFAMRWEDIHSNSYSLDALFTKYPFLKSSTYVSQLLCMYIMYVQHMHPCDNVLL